MPSFLKDFRRPSKQASTPNPPYANSTSTSTISSAPGSATPPSSLLPSEQSSASSQFNFPTNGSSNGPPPIPARPANFTSNPSRYSVAMSTMTSSSNLQDKVATSPYAPRIISVSDGSWVHQKVLLIYGQIADPAQGAFDGTLWVCHHQDRFPATSWPVCDSHFKALVHLEPGRNRLRFDFTSPKAPTPNGSAAHSSWMMINYLPLNSSPPLDLVILLGQDSPGTYDATPERKQREGNNLELAIRKFRMAAYLWQAFTGEQMNRNSFGRRCFRFEEEWQPGTLSAHDSESGQMRNEAKVHIVRTDKTVKQLRDIELAQQNPNASKAGDLFGIAMDAVRKHFAPQPGQTRYVSVLILDAHWDSNAQLIRGHAALGGGDGSIQLAIFGSQALHTYPANIEEVVPAFTDCTRTNTSFVANDCGESGSNWEAANIGIGAHMHETGHLLGCPHQEHGVMLRGYVRLNRTFTCREPYSTRTKSPGQRLCLPRDECVWHRLDCLRFRYHPCFRLAMDPAMPPDNSIQVWVVDKGNVLVTAATGITFMELFTPGDDVCKTFIEYVDPNGTGLPPKQISLTENDLRSRLPEDKRKAKLRLEIFSAGGGQQRVKDFAELSPKLATVKLPGGGIGFRGHKLGFSQMKNSQPEQTLFESKLLVQVRVHHGGALNGMEFIYADGTSQMFGKREPTHPRGTDFNLDTRRGEVIVGFYVRAGLWIDGIQVLTSLGRKSPVFGNANGGSGHTLIPPRGYNVTGLSGSCGDWVDGLSLVISR